MTQTWETTRQAVLDRDGDQCRFCEMTNSEHEDEYGQGLHIHHIIPESEGGSDEPQNLVTLCSSCHKTFESVHADTLSRWAKSHADERGQSAMASALDEVASEHCESVRYQADSITGFLENFPSLEQELGVAGSDIMSVEPPYPANVGEPTESEPDLMWHLGYISGKLSAQNQAERAAKTVRNSDRDSLYGIAREVAGKPPVIDEESDASRERVQSLKSILCEVDEEYDDEPGAPWEVVLSVAADKGIQQTKVEAELEKLKTRGDVYLPDSDHVKLV